MGRARHPREYELADSVYEDTGCPDGMIPACLTCPLDVCRYDDPGWHLREKQKRDRELLAAYAEGNGVPVLAQRFGISERQVFRVLAAAKGGIEPVQPAPVVVASVTPNPDACPSCAVKLAQRGGMRWCDGCGFADWGMTAMAMAS